MSPRSAIPVVVLCAALFAVAGCSGSGGGKAAGDFQPQRAGELTVVTAQVPEPGFWEGTAANPTGGFEFELAEKLRERFGLDRLRIVTRPFGEIVGGDLDGADVAISLITPTKSRREVLDFSDPYLDAPPALITRKGEDVPDLKTARELRWVTQKSTTLEELVREQIDPAEPIQSVGSIDEKVAAVKSGKADAALFDFALAVAIADSSDGALEVAAKLQQPERIAVALPDGSDNGDAVSAAVRALVNDGTINDLATRWIGPEADGSGKDVPVLRTSRE